MATKLLPNILIVDDTFGNLVLLEQIFSKVKINLIQALSGKEALEKTRGVDLALAIIDVWMPEMNGFELAMKMNRERRGEKVPVIFLTANAFGEMDIINGYNSGAVDYIIKPVRKEILLGKINVFIDLFNQKQTIISNASRLKKTADKLSRTNAALKISEEKYQNYVDAVLKESLESSRAFLGKSVKSGTSEARFLRLRAEEILHNKPQINVSEPSETETKNLLYELDVHRIELELQNEDLNKAISIAREAMELYDFSPSGLFTLSREGNIIRCNLSGAQMLGREQSRIINSRFGLFISQSTKPDFDHFLAKIFSSNAKETCEISILTENGNPRYAHLSGIVFGNSDSCLLTMVDITERKFAEDLLSDTRKNYESFFNSIDQFLFVLDLEGNIIHENTTVIDRLGYTKEELSGKSILLVHPPERREEAGRIVGEMLKGTADFCPVPVMTKNGVRIPVETRVFKGIWDGKPVIFGITKDITKITLSEEKFSKIFYINPSACGLSDLESHKYVEVNDAFRNLLGFEKDEVIGKTASELGILALEARETILMKAGNSERVSNIEASLRAKNGDIKHVTLSSENIYVQDKKYRFTIVNDITDYKTAEKALRESEEKYRLLIENSQDIIYTLDLEGRFLFVSPAWTVLLGHPVSEVVGKTFDEFVNPDDLHNCLNFMQKVIDTKMPQNGIEYRILRTDGVWRWHITSAVPIFDENGYITGYEGIARDVTEQKQAEMEKNMLQQLHQLAQYTEQARENERTVISRELHDDLGQVLTAIKIHMGLIRHTISDDELILKINKTTDLVSEAIKSVKRITAQLRPEILDELGLEAAIRWYTKEFTERTGIKISLGIISGIVIPTDSSLTIFRIIQESLTNISRHSGASRAYISLSKTENRINLRISDNGVGITDDDVKSKKSFGIISMKERVAFLSGTFDVYSEKGHGTVIKIVIPVN